MYIYAFDRKTERDTPVMYIAREQKIYFVKADKVKRDIQYIVEKEICGIPEKVRVRQPKCMERSMRKAKKKHELEVYGSINTCCS